MKNIVCMAAVCAVFSGSACAQSPRVSHPDILGVTFQTGPEQAIALLKKKYPKLSVTRKKIPLSADTYFIQYDGMLDIVLEANTAKVIEDTLHLNYLPDGTVIGMSRTILFQPFKQAIADAMKGLADKYGDPVMTFEGNLQLQTQAMWSDTMKPGLTMVGTQFRQTGGVAMPIVQNSPYTNCLGEATVYANDLFNPNRLYKEIYHNPIFGNLWKECGTTVYAGVQSDIRQPAYAGKLQLFIANVAAAPDLIAKLPQTMAKLPGVVHTPLVPFNAVPSQPGSAPNF